MKGFEELRRSLQEEFRPVIAGGSRDFGNSDLDQLRAIYRLLEEGTVPLGAIEQSVSYFRGAAEQSYRCGVIEDGDRLYAVSNRLAALRDAHPQYQK